jgi:hypothetical protein
MAAGPASTDLADPDSRYIHKLAERIRRGDDKTGGGCVLLLGPGVAVDPSDAQRTSVTALLARRLAADPQVQSRCTPEMENNLRHVAQLYYQVHDQDKDDLALVVKDFYAGFQDATTAFHRNLAQLPFRLCISTSPDDFMFNALREAGKNPSRAHYNFHRDRNPGLIRATEKAPLVYYLYGRGDDLDSLVLTENDLIEFLVCVVRGDPDLPEFIKGPLGDRDTTFLFLGFGFQNWYLRVLLHVLNIYGHGSRAMALEDASFFQNPEHFQTVGFFSGDHLIEFRPLRWDEFAERLCADYRGSSGSPAPAGAQPGPNAPVAFLSYASEDREAVETLGAKLAAYGIAVWQDKQNLRGGDNWRRVLRDVIAEQVDYVIVAQTRQMVSQFEGYFYHEINAALMRQDGFKEGTLFVIPVTLDDCETLKELSDLHIIDVRSDQGVSRLAREISDDWRQRPRPGAKPVRAAAGSLR